jgi:hypothetical protein
MVTYRRILRSLRSLGLRQNPTGRMTRKQFRLHLRHSERSEESPERENGATTPHFLPWDSSVATLSQNDVKSVTFRGFFGRFRSLGLRQNPTGRMTRKTYGQNDVKDTTTAPIGRK